MLRSHFLPNQRTGQSLLHFISVFCLSTRLSIWIGPSTHRCPHRFPLTRFRGYLKAAEQILRRLVFGVCLRGAVRLQAQLGWKWSGTGEIREKWAFKEICVMKLLEILERIVCKVLDENGKLFWEFRYAGLDPTASFDSDTLQLIWSVRFIFCSFAA